MSHPESIHAAIEKCKFPHEPDPGNEHQGGPSDILQDLENFL